MPGCLTMIASFLEHNAWYQGDILVLGDDILPASVKMLERLDKRITVRGLDDEYRAALTKAQIENPRRRVMFSALQAFGLYGYDRVLFCDSDLLICADLRDVFAREADLLVAPDGPNLRGNGRSRTTCNEAPIDAPEGVLRDTFNSGFVMIGSALRTPETYGRLLDFLSDDFWQEGGVRLHDQAVLNIVLEGRQEMLGVEYNFLLGHVGDTQAKYQGALSDVKVFHFNCLQKPWAKDFDAAGEAAVIYGYRAWRAHYVRTQEALGYKKFNGAQHLRRELIKTHLFLLCPNNSGSTFLSKAIGTSRHVWDLYREGQHMLGFKGPNTRVNGQLIWAGEDAGFAEYRDASNFNWPHNQKVWYFQATADSIDASVFFTKAPPFIAYAQSLDRHFDNAKFLMMIRNPYAMYEGIVRRRAALDQGPNYVHNLRVAAIHVMRCFDLQRKNQALFKDKSVFFTYEEMCAMPDQVAARIMDFVPELDDLDLDQTLFIKGRYSERLRNMNADQIGALTPQQLEVANEVFDHDLIAHFGYQSIMAPVRA
ncbi:hypothetical protein GCM10007939_20960 [Amylibacter marinus]|uniref:Lipopolysaccharide biosynthesis protein, LPS:glycosyltransferase n=2 Tax=Amylibacter marinus TaxID=1475483 RepID=A0ABQ5VWI8_9RHOB|nr:hypothetical protein GCM10007939_20960 [Amylibacter marinus]